MPAPDKRDPVVLLNCHAQYYADNAAGNEGFAKFAAELRYCAGYILALRGAITANQPSHTLSSKLDKIQTLLQTIQNKETQMDRTLQDVLDDVAAERTQIDSLGTLVGGLRQQISDALSGVTLPPAVQAKVNQAFDGIEQNKAAVVAAMNNGVIPPVVAPSPTSGASVTPVTPSNGADVTIPPATPATPADTVPGSTSPGT